MCVGKLFFSAILVLHAVQSDGGGGTRCSGGRSVRGVSSPGELHSHVDAHSGRLVTAACCDDDDDDIGTRRCHGGHALGAHHFDSSSSNGAEVMERTLSRYAQRFDAANGARRKRSIDSGLPAETGCCSANASVFFPISAVSALTGKRVHVIQAPPAMLQAVVFARCESSKSRVLDAHCQQDYVTEMMHVAALDAETNELHARREPVLVESGCSCRLNRSPPTVQDGPSVADTVATFLTMW